MALIDDVIGHHLCCRSPLLSLLLNLLDLLHYVRLPRVYFLRRYVIKNTVKQNKKIDKYYKQLIFKTQRDI